MHETPIDAMRKPEELKAKRTLLFRRFLQNPRENRSELRHNPLHNERERKSFVA